MTNSYSSCRYDSLDETNPFSTCNSGLDSQNQRNTYIPLTMAISKEDSASLYGQEKGIIKSSGGDINDPNNLTRTLKTVRDNNLYPSTNGSPWDYNDGAVKLITDANDVGTMRRQIDAKLTQMKSAKNMDNNDDSTFLYNASFYVNLLWVILATSLIYFIFTEL